MTIAQKHLVFIPLFCIAYIAIFAACVMVLWNWLVTTIFALPAISFWQAAGLLVLCKILFGTFGAGHQHHGHGCHHANKLRERWENMSPEERERIVEMHRNCERDAHTDGK